MTDKYMMRAWPLLRMKGPRPSLTRPFLQFLQILQTGGKLWIQLAVVLMIVGRSLAATETNGDQPKSAGKTNLSSASTSSNLFSDEVQGYLSKFGYLPRSDPRVRSSVHESAVRHALQNLQRFAGVTPTGELDDPTRVLLATKRCGVPDVGSIRPVEGSTIGSETRGSSHGGGGNDQNNRNRILREDGRRRWRRTTENNERRRRGKRYVSRWEQETVKYSIQSYPGRLGPGRVRRSIYDAMMLWDGNSKLKFQETGDPADSDIVVTFAEGDHGDGYPFDGPDVVLAHAFFPGPRMGGDVHFDGSEEWTDTPETTSRQVHLFSVAAHEIGHALGLNHSPKRGSLMFPYYYKHDPKFFSLPYLDVLKLQQLYGRGSATEPPTPPTTTPSTTVPTTSPQPTTSPRPTQAVPEPCNARPDAVAKIRNEIAVFQGSYFWRLDEQGYLMENPIKISRFWYGFPDNLTHIDAVYEIPGKDRIMFFIGDQYWEFATNFPTPGFPKKLTHLGLPAYVTHLDAAFVWGYNKKTYFFSGNQYWRFDDKNNKTEPDYPRNTDVWKGLTMPIDSAFTDFEENTYFLRDGQLYKFHGWFMRVEKGWPKPSSEFWSACSPPKERIIEPRSVRSLRTGDDSSFGAAPAGSGESGLDQINPDGAGEQKPGSVRVVSNNGDLNLVEPSSASSSLLGFRMVELMIFSLLFCLVGI